jgi:hypothetical protein
LLQDAFTITEEEATRIGYIQAPGVETLEIRAAAGDNTVSRPLFRPPFNFNAPSTSAEVAEVAAAAAGSDTG